MNAVENTDISPPGNELTVRAATAEALVAKFLAGRGKAGLGIPENRELAVPWVLELLPEIEHLRDLVEECLVDATAEAS